MTLTAPPVLTSGQSRWRRMVPPVLVAGGLAAAVTALHMRDPHEQGSWGMCPLAALGIHCPGCGGLRAVNDLGNFRIADAASSNLLFLLSIPVLGYIFWLWTAGRWTGRGWDPSDRWLRNAGLALAVSAAIFTILRNTTAGSWLAP